MHDFIQSDLDVQSLLYTFAHSMSEYLHLIHDPNIQQMDAASDRYFVPIDLRESDHNVKSV